MSAKSTQPSNPARRRFLQDAARGTAGCAVAGMSLAWMVQDARALPDRAIRPPGALPEEDVYAEAGSNTNRLISSDRDRATINAMPRMSGFPVRLEAV